MKYKHTLVGAQTRSESHRLGEIEKTSQSLSQSQALKDE